MKTTKCPNGCNHTNAEHAAFDAGLAAGNKRTPETACKLRGALREDWLSGHSVGLENFKAKPAPASGNAIFALTMEKAAKIMGLDIGKNADRAAKLTSVKPVCSDLSEPSHTPGPWFYSGNLHCDDENPEHGIVTDAGGRAEIAVCYYGKTSEERDANCRLVAAAPDLLKRLGCLVEVVDNSPAKVASRGFMTTDADLQRELCAARYFLAKARP